MALGLGTVAPHPASPVSPTPVPRPSQQKYRWSQWKTAAFVSMHDLDLQELIRTQSINASSITACAPRALAGTHGGPGVAEMGIVLA